MFRRNVQLLGDESKLSFYSGCSDTMASNCARGSCAAAVQIVAESLDEASMFSLALGVSTPHGIFYFDVCAWLFLSYEMYTSHLLTVSLIDQQTDLILFVVLSEVLDALLIEWRNFLVGLTDDGNRLKTGRIQYVFMRLAEESMLVSFIVLVWSPSVRFIDAASLFATSQ